MAPLLAYSAGLGRLTVISALGQPLNAEIEIVSLQSGEEDSVTARLASLDAFRQAGIDLSPALIGMQFAVDKRGPHPVIRLTTSQPINEPFLDVLIELQWATGRLVREYTFLLDPQEYKGPAPAAAPAAAPRPAPAAAAPAAPAARAEARPIPAAPSAPAAAGKHEVKKGDTLGAIARQNLPAGVTLNQMLIALFRANQEAFIRGNINLVRAGRILNIPDREAIAAIGATEANQIVHTHMGEFAEYKRKLAGAVAAAPAVPAREREVTGRITAKPEAPAPTEQKDQLRLSKVEPNKPGAPAAKAAREDDRVARERALKESQSRVSDLEKNVSDLQKLLEMKSQQLAELEKKASAKPAPAPAPAAPAPAAKAPEPAKPAAAPEKPAAAAPKPAPEAPKPAAEAPKEAPKPAAEAPKEAAKEAPKEVGKEAAKEAPKPAAEAPKAKPKPAPVKAAAPEKSFLEEFIEDPIALGGLGAVVVLLGGYGVWAWRRKKASQTKFQDSVLGAATGPGAGSVFGAAAQPAAEAPAPAAAAPGVSEVSVSGVSVGAAESDEVDPIAEADVYMAYGRDAQAEEILKEALGKDANRVAVHAKLLEIYANRKDAKSFEQTALKVKGLTNGAGPDWDKAMALGHSIDPANGLYGTGGAVAEAPAAAPAAAAPTLDFDIGGGAEAAAAGAEAKPESAALDFDLGATTPTGEKKSDFAKGGTLIIDSKEVQEQQAASSGLDFDLGGAADDGEKTMLLTPKKPAEAPKADPDATVAMDFDLNIDLGSAKTEPAPAKPADAPLDLGGLSLDLGTPAGEAPAGGADPKWQEVATKLDLAKAYQEMGDKDGARELLNEVVKEGDAAQQGQAKQMLAALG
ncbi:MAG TPA: FimV/HubP family polar landmark protein [Burkholderiales bacterium]|nr:FimV/HubP family polar landmark protein [Burkholderiales bacterium]